MVWREGVFPCSGVRSVGVLSIGPHLGYCFLIWCAFKPIYRPRCAGSRNPLAVAINAMLWTGFPNHSQVGWFIRCFRWYIEWFFWAKRTRHLGPHTLHHSLHVFPLRQRPTELNWWSKRSWCFLAGASTHGLPLSCNSPAGLRYYSSLGLFLSHTGS